MTEDPETPCPRCFGIPSQRSSWRRLCDLCFPYWAAMRDSMADHAGADDDLLRELGMAG